MKKKIFYSLITISLLLASCNESEEVNKDPTIVNPYNLLTYSEFDESTFTRGLTPNTGDVNILVVPVEFSDFRAFTNSQINNINICFNGDESLDNKTPYWESVKSYYHTSSYNYLNFNFVVTDIYESPLSEDEFIEQEETNLGVPYLLNDMYSKLTINNDKVNYKDFDSDYDGYIDGIWLIYNCNDRNEVLNKQNFWAYTSYLQSEPNLDNPTFNTYANGDYVFFNRDTRGNYYDTHTFIHETGHMLGLDDYYSYEEYHDASGWLQMMNSNIGDHDSFTKYSLGWINPKVIDKEEELVLKPFNESGEALIIPSESYYNNAFGEYIIVEYYRPTLLNELDSQYRYPDISGKLLYSEEGIIIYHIDARLMNVLYDEGSNKYYGSFINLNDYTFKDYRDDDYISLAANNTLSGSYDGKTPLIEIITSTNQLTSGLTEASNLTLFKEGDSFDPLTSSDNFFDNGKFHDGSSVNFKIDINSLSEEGANLTITSI